MQGGSDRSFGLVFAAVFVLVGLFPLWHGMDPRWWALAGSGLFLGAALAFPRQLAPLNRLWTRFGALLHRLTTPLILGVIFFLVVTPIGLIMRLFGKNPLALQVDRTATSYWILRKPPVADVKSMKFPF
ncbi:MAG: hypothetical protein HQL56_17595 [Magnetococcales bacterium]|nr:hypothetical protein [Magnetococcales bacterium]